MCGQDIGTASLAQVPDAHRVVVAARGNVVAIGREANSQHLLNMPLQHHNVLARPQIPDAAAGIKARRAGKLRRAIDGEKV